MKEYKRLEELFDMIPFGIYITDMETYDIIFFNSFFKKRFGNPRKRKCYDLIFGNEAPCLFCKISQLQDMAKKGVAESIVFEQFNDKDDCNYRLEERAIYWMDENLVKYTIAIDTTEQKKTQNSLAEAHARLVFQSKELESKNIKLQNEIDHRRIAENNLQQAKEEAEKANLAKTRFLANVSHELRTPLNAIIGFSNLLMRKASKRSDADYEDLGIICRSGEYLLDLINDILDISRIEAGQLALSPGGVDLNFFIQGIVEVFDSKAVGKGLKFTLKKDVCFPPYIRADEGKLRQIIINLLGNAIKYTHQGSITLSVDGKHTANGSTIQFKVKDTGIGIHKKHLEEIFDPFVQVGQTLQQGAGVGLGLAITRQLVNLMGGTLTAESKVEAGSVFVARIPVEIINPISVKKKKPKKKVVGLAPDQDPRLILIVEDDDNSRRLLKKQLRHVGFEVREAVNGKQGVIAYQKWHPDLIWMDIRMPMMDGIEATKRIRKLEKESQTRAKTPIIAVTAHAFEEERQKIMMAGCEDLLVKPFHPDDVFNMLSEHLDVVYVFEDEIDEQKSNNHEINTAQIAVNLGVLPNPLLEALCQAVNEGEIQQIIKVALSIIEYDKKTGQMIKRLAEECQLTILSSIIENQAKIDQEPDHER